MHILLTDLLICPRCGPGFGLIVLADAIEERRVLEGSLGCANCRNSYPIAAGVADLRLGGGGAPGGPPLAAGDSDRAFRLAALSGARERPGALLVSGAEPALLAEVARLLPDAQLVATAPHPPPADPPQSVSWIVHDARLPFRDGALSAAATLASPDPETRAELRRVLLPGARLVVDGVAPGTADSLRADGWDLLLEQDGVAVASYPARR